MASLCEYSCAGCTLHETYSPANHIFEKGEKQAYLLITDNKNNSFSMKNTKIAKTVLAGYDWHIMEFVISEEKAQLKLDYWENVMAGDVGCYSIWFSDVIGSWVINLCPSCYNVIIQKTKGTKEKLAIMAEKYEKWTEIKPLDTVQNFRDLFGI